MLALAVLVGVVGSSTADDLPTLLRRASAARTAQDWALAERLLERAYAIEPAPEILFNRARVAEELDALAAAQGLYTALLTERGLDSTIRARVLERTHAIAALLRGAVIRVADAGLALDGVPHAPGLIGGAGSDVVASTTRGDRTHVDVVATPTGRVVVLGAADLVVRTSACVDLGEVRLTRFDERAIDTVARVVCLVPGAHTLALAGRAPLVITLPAHTTTTLPTDAEETSSIRAWGLLIGGGCALAGSGLAWAIADAERSAVLSADRDATGALVSISQRDAVAAEAAGDRAATVSAVLLVTAAVLVGGGLIDWWLDDHGR